MWNEDFPERITRFRRETGLTQQALASFIGVSQRTVSRWERGVDRPNTELMTRIAALLCDDTPGQLPSVYDAIRNAPVPLALVDNHGRVLIASRTYTGRQAIARPGGAGGLPVVLLVEDDEDVLKASSAVLKRWQFVAVGVTEGETAVAMVAQGDVSPDVAVIDFLLPGRMDGVETAKALRNLIPDLPVLIVSGEATPERIRKIADSGLPLITKPVDPEQVQVALKTLIAG